MTNNNINWKQIGIQVVLFLLIFAGFFGLEYCKRQPDTTEPTTQQQALTGKLDTHAIRSAIERQYQQRETKLIAAYSDSLAKSKVIARKKGDKAVVSVKAYQNAPSIAKCDTAIADLQSQVSELETTVAITDTIIASQNRLNASLNMTVQRQEGVISEVAKIGQDALAENAKLLKPKLKVYATAAFEKHPINNNIKAGGTGTYDQWLFGYQAGILQPTHEIKAGMLLRFKK